MIKTFTLLIFLHGANGAETELARQPDLTRNECVDKSMAIYAAAHAADIAELDAACLPETH